MHLVMKGNCGWGLYDGGAIALFWISDDHYNSLKGDLSGFWHTIWAALSLEEVINGERPEWQQMKIAIRAVCEHRGWLVEKNTYFGNVGGYLVRGDDDPTKYVKANKKRWWKFW